MKLFLVTLVGLICLQVALVQAGTEQNKTEGNDGEGEEADSEYYVVSLKTRFKGVLRKLDDLINLINKTNSDAITLKEAGLEDLEHKAEDPEPSAKDPEPSAEDPEPSADAGQEDPHIDAEDSLKQLIETIGMGKDNKLSKSDLETMKGILNGILSKVDEKVTKAKKGTAPYPTMDDIENILEEALLHQAEEEKDLPKSNNGNKNNTKV